MEHWKHKYICWTLTAGLIVLLLLCFTGCTTNKEQRELSEWSHTAPVAAHDASKGIGEADGRLALAEADLDHALTFSKPYRDFNLGTSIGNAKVRVSDTRAGLKDAKVSADEAAAKSLADQREIARLHAADPVRAALRWSAFGCYGLGVLLLTAALASLFLSVISAIIHTENLLLFGLVALVSGSLFGALARWEVVIELLVGCLACGILVIVSTVLLVKWLRTRHGTKEIVQSIESGVMTGAIGWTKKASKIADEVQGSMAKRLVNDFQTKIARAKEEFHDLHLFGTYHLPGAAVAANGISSLTPEGGATVSS